MGNFLLDARMILEAILIEEQEITNQELNDVEKYLDAIFSKLGMDVEFGNHFKDRLKDARNGKPITKGELILLFQKEYQKYGKNIAQLGPDKEAVLTDLSTNLNTPIMLKWNRNKGVLEMVAKTIMRKKGFRPNNDSEKHYKVN